MKICSKCGDEKELNLFYKMKTNPDGKDNYCKECRKEKSKEYRKTNRAAIRKYDREYKRKVNGSSEDRYIIKDNTAPIYIYDLESYSEEDSYVYLIKENTHTGRVKIGHTKNVETRFITMKNTYAWENALTILYKKKTKNAKRRERELHMIFAGKRVHAEWFELEKKDIKFIEKFLEKDQDVSVDDILEGRIFDKKTV